MTLTMTTRLPVILTMIPNPQRVLTMTRTFPMDLVTIAKAWMMTTELSMVLTMTTKLQRVWTMITTFPMVLALLQ